MTKRQQKILKLIIKNYINTAEPVGSRFLKERCSLNISSATIRNEMANLVKERYLSKPHISAGRVPTLKAFKYYIDNLLEVNDLKKEEKKRFKKIVKKHQGEEQLKEVLKQIVEFSKELGILIFNKNSFYYTGFSYLFEQPEFEQHNSVAIISRAADSLDSIMGDLSHYIKDETRVLVGDDNPFSEFCGSIFTSFDLPNQSHKKIMGLIGPTRMDYAKNLALLNYSKELLTN